MPKKPRIPFPLVTDSYKHSHRMQVPPDTDYQYGYFEARKPNENIVFFGLQYFLKAYLEGIVLKKTSIHTSGKLLYQHFNGNVANETAHEEAWTKLLNKHGGLLPLRIKAVPEGTILASKNVLFTVESTDPEFHWLATYVETLLDQIWYPCTVATNSHKLRKVFKKVATRESTESRPSETSLGYMLHDFGVRGTSSMESAMIGGLAHLIPFRGTDNNPALYLAQEYYGIKGPVGYSAPAAEHSTIMSWPTETEAFTHILKTHKGLVSVVSDTYDIENACSEIWPSLAELKNHNGKVIIRPDSGELPESLIKVLEILWDKFGGKTHSDGLRTLNPKIGVMQGDGITPTTIPTILQALHDNRFSISNLVLGMGGGLLQQVNRDDYGFTFKLSHISGKTLGARDVSKSPNGDVNKKSKAGKLALIETTYGYQTIPLSQLQNEEDNVLRTVFNNGIVTQEYSMWQVRNNYDASSSKLPEPSAVH